MQTPSAGSNDPKTPLLDGSHSASASPLSAHHEAASSNLGDVASVHAGAAQVPAASASPSHVSAAGANDGLRNVRQCVSDVKSIQWPWSKGREEHKHRQGVINQLKEIALTAKTEDERLAAVDGLKELSANTWRFGFGSRRKDRYMAMEALRDIGRTPNPDNDATQEKVWKAATHELAYLMPKSATAVDRFYEVHQRFSGYAHHIIQNNRRLAYLAEKYLEVRPELRRKFGLEYAGGLTSEASCSRYHWYVQPAWYAAHGWEKPKDIGYAILASVQEMMNIIYAKHWELRSYHPADNTELKIWDASDRTHQDELPYIKQLVWNNTNRPYDSPLIPWLHSFHPWSMQWSYNSYKVS